MSPDELASIRRDYEASIPGDIHRLLGHIEYLSNAMERASEEGHDEGQRHALCEMMDRLGMSSVVPFSSNDAPQALADALWNHVSWLEDRARNEALEEAAKRLESETGEDLAFWADEIRKLKR